MSDKQFSFIENLKMLRILSYESEIDSWINRSWHWQQKDVDIGISIPSSPLLY